MDPMIMIFGGLAVVLLFVMGSFSAALYKKVGPNTAMIVSGGYIRPKVIVGGGTVVLPLVNRMDLLSLELMSVEIGSQTPMFTEDNVPLRIEATAQVKVAGDEESINTAAENFLGKSTEETEAIAQKVLKGHLRSVVAKIRVEELISDYEAFACRVWEVAASDLAKMGLTVVSLTVTELSDTVGYLDNLGKKELTRPSANAAEFVL